MSAIVNHNELIGRITTDFDSLEPIHGYYPVARNPLLSVGMAAHRGFHAQPIPSSLPSGVTAYLPTQIFGGTNLLGFFLGVYHMIDLGSIDLSTNTFTPGSTMGTTTFGGQTVSRSGILFAEVTTALNSTPGNLDVTYIDQSGNAAETNTAAALATGAPVGSGVFVRLNIGDGAVREVTGASNSGGTSPTGVIKFWGLIPIGSTITNAYHGGFVIDAFNKRPLYRLPASAVIGGVVSGGTAAGGLEGSIRYVGDQA